jgi:hypothetical protein
MDPVEIAALLTICEKAGEHGDLLSPIRQAALERLVQIAKTMPKSRKQPDAQAVRT